MHCKNKSTNKMITKVWFLLKLLTFQGLFTSPPPDPGFDFFYLALQWPGAYCDTKRACCYPTTGKPAADFGIHGLWPNYNNGSYPSNCDPSNEFDPSEISDLVSTLQTKWPTLSCPSNEGYKFWEHEWEKHGTCSESVMDQHGYFEKTLALRDRINLLQILTDAGIKPNDEFYKLKDIKKAIEKATGFTPVINCNRDPEKNRQLHEILLCVDKSGTEFMDCPMPTDRCPYSHIQFAKF